MPCSPRYGSYLQLEGEKVPIKFNCPKCGQKASAPNNAAGVRGKCPGCSASVVVPAVSSARLPSCDEDVQEVNPVVEGDAKRTQGGAPYPVKVVEMDLPTIPRREIAKNPGPQQQAARSSLGAPPKIIAFD